MWIVRDARFVPGWWAERIKRLRDERGWTQDELATRAGITQAQVSRLESGEQTDPRKSTLEGLADAFGMSVDAVLGRSASPREPAGDAALVNTDESNISAVILPARTAVA